MGTTDPPLFISYKSEDRALAEDLYRHLTAAGFDVWFDVEALDRVALWHDLIEQACEHARIILPVLTPRWPSQWTECETYGAEYVVPLVFEGEGRADQLVPAPIREWQALDLRGATDETWQQLFGRLRAALDQIPPQQRPRLHDLPFAANRYFVGREALLAELHEKLCQAPATVLTHSPAFVVEGQGGIGKTTLAREYAERFWRLYRDLLWVSAANTELLPLEFARVAEKLGVAVGDDVDANARRALDELTRGPRRLLIMDNAHDEESIQDWLPKTGKCRTIITSRFTAWSAEVQTMHVHVLESGPAQDLLIRRSGVADSEANRAMADELAKELGYLPLALEQAAAYIHQQHGTLEHYLEQYAQHRQRLLARRQPGATRYPDSVATTWQMSIEKLGPEAVSILRVLAFVAPDPLPRRVLRLAGDILGDLDELAVDEALMELHRYSLIELQAEDGPLTIHRLLQAVQEDGLEVGERQGWVEKALRVVERAFPEADYSNWQVCEALLPHALACSAHAEKHEVLTREAGLLPGLIAVFFQERGQLSAAREPGEQAVRTYERLAATDPGNAAWQRDLSVSHDRIGDVRVAQGDLSGALEAYQHSLDIRERLAAADAGNAAWQRDLSVSHNKLGDVRVAQGDLSGALEEYEADLAIAQRLAAADPGNAAWQ
ncbi:TIR domain-containing protein, partial [bacterium]|nr:TIR domain-containing protein [bacterium]